MTSTKNLNGEIWNIEKKTPNFALPTGGPKITEILRKLYY